MQLTGKQIVEEGLVTNYVPEAVQQQGMDVRLMSIRAFGTKDEIGRYRQNDGILEIGFIPAKGKTKLPNSFELTPCVHSWGEVAPNFTGWILEPGYYEVIFDEGVKMPDNRVMVLISRSSAVRCGAFIECGQFDAGFETEHMGCFFKVEERVAIEQHARIAQLRFTTTESVEEKSMYCGQWQNDKQRKNQ